MKWGLLLVILVFAFTLSFSLLSQRVYAQLTLQDIINAIISILTGRPAGETTTAGRIDTDWERRTTTTTRPPTTTTTKTPTTSTTTKTTTYTTTITPTITTTYTCPTPPPCPIPLIVGNPLPNATIKCPIYYCPTTTSTTKAQTTTTTTPSGEINYICSSCNSDVCVCNITNCNSGYVDLYRTSDCSGVPFAQIRFYIPTVSNYDLNVGTGYAKVFCDNGASSSCQSYYVSPINFTTTTTTTTTTTQTCISTPCEWGIQYSPTVGARDGFIPKGSAIQIVYKPSTTKYLNGGEKVNAPNNYFELGYLGFNTDKFANINIKPVSGINAYWGTSTYSNLNGLEVSSDVADSLEGVNVTSHKFYFLYEKITGSDYPVILAYYDSVQGKIIIVQRANANPGAVNYLLNVKYLGVFTHYSIRYSSAINGNPISVVSGEINNQAKVFAIYKLKTSWTTSSAPDLKLGDSPATSEPGEVTAVTEGTTYNIGLSHNDVVADGGLIVKNPNENGRADQVALKVPDKELKVKAYFGHQVGLGWQWRDNIDLNGYLSAFFPNSGVIRPEDLPDTLKRGVFLWKGNNYDYHEQVDISQVRMRHDYGTALINGQEKMVVESNKIRYDYVFDKDLNFGGSIVNPEYTYPVKIKLMGKDFIIVGAGTSSIKVLAGIMGTATATSGVSYGDYIIYAETGVNNQWARLSIKDKFKNTVDTKIIDEGNSADSFVTGLTIRVTDVRALQDGTIVGTDLVVGPIGSVEKEYDTSADVTSTGTASDCFTGTTTQVCKNPCPYECCENDSLYLDKLCPLIPCPLCPGGQTCPPCQQFICKDHQCVLPGGHDVAVFRLRTYPYSNYANEPIEVRGEIQNLGDFSETVNITLEACLISLQTVVGGGGSISITSGTTVVTNTSRPLTCQRFSLLPVIVEPGGIRDVATTINITAGYYQLGLAANIAQDSDPSNNIQYTFINVQPPLPKFSVFLKKGWNLFSFPVNVYSYYTANTNCIVNSTVWTMKNGIYVEANNAENGYGYWIKVVDDCVVNMSGQKLAIQDFRSLTEGWNLIGAPSDPANIEDIKGSCEIEKGPLWYDPSIVSYVKRDTLQPGNGYFVKVKQSCRLGEGMPPPPP